MKHYDFQTKTASVGGVVYLGRPQLILSAQSACEALVRRSPHIRDKRQLIVEPVAIIIAMIEPLSSAKIKTPQGAFEFWLPLLSDFLTNHRPEFIDFLRRLNDCVDFITERQPSLLAFLRTRRV